MNIKEWILSVGVTDTQTRHPLSISDEKMSKFNTPQKWKKIMKHAQNRRCTSSIREQSFGKIWMKQMKTFGVTDYTNLVPLKCCGRTDGRTYRTDVLRFLMVQIYGVNLTRLTPQAYFNPITLYCTNLSLTLTSLNTAVQIADLIMYRGHVWTDGRGWTHY